MNKRWLNAFLTTASILLVAFVCAGMNGGISVGASNHVGLLPVVRRILNPNYLPNDFNISLRFYHHRIFAYLIAALAACFGENNAFIILHLFGIIFCSTALYLLCRQFRLSRLAFLVVGGMLATGFAWTGLGLEENDFLGNPEIQPPLFAHAFTLLVLYALAAQRLRWAAALAGCVVLFHLQIGVIVTLMILPIFLMHARAWQARQMGQMVLCYLIPAAPALAHLLGMMQRGLLKPVTQVHSLASYIEFRHPHHFALMSRTHALWVTGHLISLVLIWRWAKRNESESAAPLAILMSSGLALAVLALAHFTDYYLIRQDKFANVQAIRVSPLITVMGAIGLVWWLNVWLAAPQRRRIFNVIALLMLAGWGYRTAHLPESETDFGIRYYNDESDKRGSKKDWVNICNWIREHGAPDANYLTPPANDGFTALSHRSNLAEFKINPDGALRMNEWFERLTDLTGGRLPQLKGFENRQPLNQAYGELSEQQFVALAQKYKADFAVVPKSAKLPFPVLYQNKGLKLVAILSL